MDIIRSAAEKTLQTKPPSDVYFALWRAAFCMLRGMPGANCPARRVFPARNGTHPHYL